MRLLSSKASPYARCVRVLIQHLGINNIEELLVNPFDNTAELLDANPLGQIPCLITNDGMALFDSEVIMRYLDTELGDRQMFGASSGNWLLECQYSLVKGLIDSAVKLRQEQMRQEEGVRSAFWTSRFEQALLRGLMQIELQTVITQTTIQAPQLALICLLDYVDFRHSGLDWRKVAPATALWFGEMRDLPAFIQTRPY
ncbi:glutathione S-transferase [Shewanella glacialipiscicola]|uniref:Glutathione S-transferase n=1 Tax=Shewanella glacialipiscicola TaxID=614069 RepID=A0ABQ6IZB8_9GAMM|nr:glutathione S-transferase N-terminal domain-containing protein [Shewanella glacialipiscicola]MCL1086039.1 glutathione S-transferase N-terminal domain-containing protein [Shewanella glacialipiscicola]MCU7993711.1 glutathione S-transferase N-terminal domain-containing protein [Shewanella glacialipiscicola]MCU8025029.1 glutathione S-transferase N-terminal domain-containing protein [Shewanella glacialipiscicola]GIU07961.1 glutathione S-transferase [Shewanella glacialipiscicola]GMA80797.1 glutat